MTLTDRLTLTDRTSELERGGHGVVRPSSETNRPGQRTVGRVSEVGVHVPHGGLELGPLLGGERSRVRSRGRRHHVDVVVRVELLRLEWLGSSPVAVDSMGCATSAGQASRTGRRKVTILRARVLV